MSYETNVSYSGKKNISTLGGQVRIDEGRGGIIIKSNDKKVVQMGALESGGTGLDWYDADTSVNYMRAGELPNGVGGLIVANEGIQVDEIFQ